ncbi:SIS domain-containing protein [Agromyces subbeticus]|uniref:SIS domain-containing protein n=1 Tax=Agromyces subbeticus TaxID=293890 RepID=UPI0003B64480|nr:SIS domain-containing protein [Agromyces subbeticus]
MSNVRPAGPTPFELDIFAQPEALRALAAAGADARLAEIAGRPWSRVVLTGMGSSHFAGLPTWRALTSIGLPVWTVDAGQLLDTPGLITPDTLVIATSQSGASGEVVELIERAEAGELHWGGLIGVAANESSPLARAADLFLPLRSGEEATVSTKSYLNTLAVHRRIAAAFGADDEASVERDIVETAERVAPLVTFDTTELARTALAFGRPRLVAVGWGDSAATAQYAALIVKESSKVPIEGFVGGQFRHGPYELAGPGLTAVLFGASAADPDGPLARIARDLVATGAAVVLVGDLEIDGATTLRIEQDGSLAALAAESVVAESLAVAVAHANGVEPGAFAYGSKVTVKL